MLFAASRPMKELKTPRLLLREAAKCIIVHTGATESADATRLITMPDASDDLYWQDVVRVINALISKDDGDGRGAVDISNGVFSRSLLVELGYS